MPTIHVEANLTPEKLIEAVEQLGPAELSPQEYEELLRMTEQMEGVEVRRLECLAQLARLRQTSLPELMKDLGIAPPPYR